MKRTRSSRQRSALSGLGALLLAATAGCGGGMPHSTSVAPASDGNRAPQTGVIGLPNPSATPTAAPSGAPAATPTPAPGASATPTATPTPMPTATPAPKPTATPTPKPTATPTPSPTPVPVGVLDLKTVCAYSVLAPSLTLGAEDPGFVTGTVALTAFPIGPSSSALGGASIENGSTVSGSITVLNGGTKVSISGGSSVAKGVVTDAIDLGVSAQDAIARSRYYASLPATMSVSNSALTAGTKPVVPKAAMPYHLGTITIQGKAGLNVLNLPSLRVTDQDVVLNAPAGATFVINVTGTVDLENANLTVSGGMDERQVLVNVVPPSGAKNASSVTLKSEDDQAGDPLVQFEGSLLAPQSSQVKVETAIIHGVIAAGSALDLREKTGVMGECPSTTTTAR